MSEQARRVVDQLSYLLDEVAALESVIATVPTVVLQTSPVEGEPTVMELLKSIAARDREVRIPVLRGLLTAVRHEEQVPSAEAGAEVLSAIRECRQELLRVVRELGDVSEARVVVDGEELLVIDYLYRVVQADAATLRRAAERVFEARPLGSPGFSRA